MNKNLIGFEDNFEVESLMVETGMKPVMSINDLTDAEREAFEPMTLEMNMEDIMEMCR